MKKRDKTKQAKLEKSTTKRAVYEKERRKKYQASKAAKAASVVEPKA
jgi:hypothetical protein